MKYILNNMKTLYCPLFRCVVIHGMTLRDTCIMYGVGSMRALDIVFNVVGISIIKYMKTHAPASEYRSLYISEGLHKMRCQAYLWNKWLTRFERTL